MPIVYKDTLAIRDARALRQLASGGVKTV
jgi:hypothetical protein